MFILIIACVTGRNKTEEEEQVLSDRTGEELLEDYNSALCDLYMEATCRTGFSECSAPVGNFSDWADCMNSQLLSQQHCAHLPTLMEEERADTEMCIMMLETASCNEAVCFDSEPLFRYDACETVADLLVQNCSAFGP